VWVKAKESNENPNEIKKYLLLAKDKNRYIACHHAACFGRLEALETLWSLAKEVELILDELWLAETGRGKTALHMAAQEIHIKI